MKIKLAFPADARFVSVLRAVVAGAAASEGLTIDEIDDLAIAVSEAASHLIAGSQLSRIAATARSVDGGFEVLLDSSGGGGPWPPSEWGNSMSGRVLEALSDEVSFDFLPGRASIRIVKRSRG